MPSINLPKEIVLLTLSCLQWTPDGELCAEDRLVLISFFRQVDPRLVE
jgi:hypothetical protein